LSGEAAFAAICADPREVVETLLMCAAHCQGGNSEAGARASMLLGCPFPVNMASLETRAVQLGLNPRDLWPWLYRMREHRAAIAAAEGRTNG
jgi:hypothetical protein